MSNLGFIIQEPSGNGIVSHLGDEELGIYPITPVDCCLTAASGSAHFPAPEWTVSSPEKAIRQKDPDTEDGRQQVCIRW